MSDVRRKSHRDMFSLAGWLFADLLLGLAIIFLAMGAAVRVTPASPPTLTALAITPSAPPPLPTYTPPPPLPTYTPPPTLLPPIITGLEETPIIVIVPPDQNPLARMQSELAYLNGRRAGFILTFGYSHDVPKGVKLAAEANRKIKAQPPFPDMFRVDTPTRDLSWNPDGSGITGTLRFEIFFISKIG